MFVALMTGCMGMDKDTGWVAHRIPQGSITARGDLVLEFIV